MTLPALLLLLLAGAAPRPPASGPPGDPPPKATPQEGSYREVAGERARVRYGPGDSLRAVRTLELLEAQPPLPGLPAQVPTGVIAYLAPTEGAFDSLTGGRVPEWGAGVAIPSRMTLVIPAYVADRTRGWSETEVLRHEWAHLALHQHLEGLRIPRWFDEGYATWVSGGWDAAEVWRLRVALATGSAPPLDSLTLEWPRGRAGADLAYLLSATALEYLAGESGERGLSVLLSRWRTGSDFDEAFRRTYGVTLGQFEEDWRAYVKERYGWLFVLSHSLIFWLVLSVLLVVMVWIRRRRNRQAMARLRARELPDRPAFWEAGDEEGGRGG